MMEKNQNKYKIEKVLHELIRDLPEVRRMSEKFEYGYLTIEAALEEIAYIVRHERS